MRQRKIRGHNKIQKQVEIWRKANLQIDSDNLLNSRRDYVKISVSPFSNISLISSEIPHPKRKTKLLILSGLLDIYDSWKKQLDATGKPYYLKVWLFEDRISKSQVVCAVGDMLNFYDKTFSKTENNLQIKSSVFGQLKDRIEKYSWEPFLDKDIFSDNDVGEPSMYKSTEDYIESKTWFTRKLKKTHRKEKFNDENGNAIQCYLFRRGKLWVGSKN